MDTNPIYLLLQGVFTAIPISVLHKVHNFTFIYFSLPTFMVEWTRLDLRSRGELNRAAAMGTEAQTSVCWAVCNLSLGILCSIAYSHNDHSRDPVSFMSPDRQTVSALAQNSEDRSSGRNGPFSWKHPSI